MVTLGLAAVLVIAAAVDPAATSEAEQLSPAVLEGDGECSAKGGEACAVSALQRRAAAADAEGALMPALPRSDNKSASTEDALVRVFTAPAGMVLVGEGFCCWDEASCRQEEKEGPGGAFFSTEDGTQCNDPAACGGTTVLELCGRTEGCEAITLFAKSSSESYVWDCQLHWASMALCSTLCDAPREDNVCSKRKLPAAFQACGHWYGECQNVTNPMSEIQADGTKDKWCYKKKA